MNPAPSRVYIATTTGPVAIRQLVAEAGLGREFPCVMCIEFGSEQTAVSRRNAYNAWVRSPTGSIERDFGCANFRMDVARDIEDGDSWQLGAYVAHLLYKEGALAQKGVSENTIVWATGAVNALNDVGIVSDLGAKLETSRPLFAAAAKAGTPVLLLVPKALEEQGRGWLENETTIPGKAELAAMDSANELHSLFSKKGLIAVLGDPAAPPPAAECRHLASGAASTDPTHRPRRRRAAVAVRAALAITLGLGAYLLWDLPQWMFLSAAGDYAALDSALASKSGFCPACDVAEKLIANKDSESGSLKTSAVVIRPVRGIGCLSKAPATAATVLPLAAKEIAVTNLQGLCAVNYRIENPGPEPRTLFVRFEAPGSGVREERERRLAPGDSMTFPVRISTFATAQQTNHLLWVAGPADAKPLGTWVPQMIDAMGLDAAGQRLARFGIVIGSASHTLESPSLGATFR